MVEIGVLGAAFEDGRVGAIAVVVQHGRQAHAGRAARVPRRLIEERLKVGIALTCAIRGDTRAIVGGGGEIQLVRRAAQANSDRGHSHRAHREGGAGVVRRDGRVERAEASGTFGFGDVSQLSAVEMRRLSSRRDGGSSAAIEARANGEGGVHAPGGARRIVQAVGQAIQPIAGLFGHASSRVAGSRRPRVGAKSVRVAILAHSAIVVIAETYL